MNLPTAEAVLEQLQLLADANYNPAARASAARWAWQFLPGLSIEDEYTAIGDALGYMAGADTPDGVPGEREHEFVFEAVDFEACRARVRGNLHGTS